MDFYETHKTNSDTLIFKIVKNILYRLELDFHNIRGKCFNGASNFSGIYKRLLQLE